MDIQKAFDQLRFKKARFVIYTVSGIDVNVQYVSTRKEFLADMKKKLDDMTPAFVVYDYEFVTKDQRRSDTMFTLVWVPENTPPSARVSLTYATKSFHDKMNGTILGEVHELDEFEDFIKDEQPDPTRM